MENERSLINRFASMEQKLSDASVLLSLGKANELNFFIFDYSPKDELLVRQEVLKLKKNNPNIQEFDLFNIIVDLLKRDGFLDQVKQFEKEYDSKTLLENIIQPYIALNSYDGPFLKYIKDNVIDDGKHIVLLTGVGKAYPMIRSHTVLNNLQTIVHNNPVVMMYPGRYDQKSVMCLKLFDILGDDNYYRAFPLEERISK